MATKGLNNPFALLDSVGDDEVKPQSTVVKRTVAKQITQPKPQEPPKPKGPVVGSELKEAPKQPKQPKQPKPAEEKVAKDTPKEELFQKVPEKKKNTDHDVQKAPKKFRSRHGEVQGEKGVFSSGSNRVFERKSGTGRGHENKKGGSGKGNWGTHKDQIADSLLSKETHEHAEATSKVSVVEVPEQAVAATPPATTPVTATPATPNTTPAEVITTPVVITTAPPPAEIEEDKSISYAEWLKKSEKSIEVPLPRALRAAGEGIDDTSGWANIEVQRTEDKPVVVSAKKEDKKEKKPTNDKKEEKKENKKPTTAAVPLDKVFNLTVKVEEKEERNFKKGPRGDKGEKPKGRGRGKRAGVGVSSPNRIQSANKKPEEFNLANDAFPSLSPTQAKHTEVTNTPQVTTPATTQPQQTTVTTPNPST